MHPKGAGQSHTLCGSAATRWLAFMVLQKTSALSRHVLAAPLVPGPAALPALLMSGAPGAVGALGALVATGAIAWFAYLRLQDGDAVTRAGGGQASSQNMARTFDRLRREPQPTGSAAQSSPESQPTAGLSTASSGKMRSTNSHGPLLRKSSYESSAAAQRDAMGAWGEQHGGRDALGRTASMAELSLGR